MSIKIDLASRSSLSTNPTIHHMPCSIEFDGEAKVSEYFTTGCRKGSNEDFTGTFRGRPMNGCKIDIPSGYTGLILKEQCKPFTDEDEREFKIKGEFKDYTSWNLDLQCTKNDHVHQALHWIDISSSVHDPVEDSSSPKSNGS